jgi:hypothetical protein
MDLEKAVPPAPVVRRGKVTVNDPEGRQWNIQRRYWHGWELKWRENGDLGIDGGSIDLSGVDDPAGFVIIMLLAIVFVVLVVLGIPLLLFGVEALVILLFAAGSFAVRSLSLAPFKITARTASGEVVEQRARGWKGSRLAIARIASDIQAGRPVGSGDESLVVSPPALSNAMLGIMMGLLWLGGLGSILSIWLGRKAWTTPGRHGSVKVVAATSILLGVLGIALTVAIVIDLATGATLLRSLLGDQVQQYFQR